MRILLQVAASEIELRVVADEDGLHAQVTRTMKGWQRDKDVPVIDQVIPWNQFRQEDKPNGKIEGQAAPAIATIDEAHTFSEDDAQAAHESLSRDADRRYE